MTKTPRVLNYKTHGLPDGAVYIGRANPHYGLKRSKWANPFVEDRHGTREEIIDHFKRWLYTTPDERSEVIARFKLPRSLHGVSVGPLINDIHELRGKDLVCWCAPAPCHGDLLLAARQCLAAPGGAVSNPLTDWMHHRSPPSAGYVTKSRHRFQPPMTALPHMR